MAKQTPPEKRPELVIPREEAEQKIQERIEEGRELLSRKISDEYELENLRTDYTSWTEYNYALLANIEHTGGLADQYEDAKFGARSISMNPTIHDNVKYVHDDINLKLRAIISIHKRLELVPEAFSISQQSAHEFNKEQDDQFIITVSRSRLLEMVNGQYDLNGFRTLCYHLSQDPDNLAGDTKIDKARELILSLQKQGRLLDLIFHMRQEFPHIPFSAYLVPK